LNTGPHNLPEVPAERIAQRPSIHRDLCKLLIYHRAKGNIDHVVFKDLPDFIACGDVLVLNHSKVRPARVEAKKVTGGRVEILFLEPERERVWRVLLRPFLNSGVEVVLPDGRRAMVGGRLPEGEIELLSPQTDPLVLMEKHGTAPLPPYIKRSRPNQSGEADQNWYQTVYAKPLGSVAAPTAGLHFTRPLLDRLVKKGIKIATLTHHIGWGTFKPIRAKNPKDHRMLPERFDVDSETTVMITGARKRGHRVIGVGTSVVRALESCLQPDGTLQCGSGKTELFIYPPYPIRSIDGMITNFHLPHSTPLALIDALIGKTARLRIYAEALKKGYLFYSYGDAMLVLP
jgi:S-adenosylmethionine:tRNA ribosyltransferase-isomerase